LEVCTRRGDHEGLKGSACPSGVEEKEYSGFRLLVSVKPEYFVLSEAYAVKIAVVSGKGGYKRASEAVLAGCGYADYIVSPLCDYVKFYDV
jgi:hypothetical protein